MSADIPRLITNLKLVRDDSHVMHHPAIEEVIAKLVEMDSWVKVSERLPDECEKVLAIFDDSYGGCYILASREGDKWFDESPTGDLRQLCDITHWQSIKPPAIDAASGERK